MRKIAFFVLCSLLGLAIAASAQTNQCEAPPGGTSLTVPPGTQTRLGFCHDLKDVNGTTITRPVFIATITTPVGAPLGEINPLVVTEIGAPLADGRRWYESSPQPAMQNVNITITALNANGRSLPSTSLALNVTAGLAVPSAVTNPRILR